MDNFIKYRILRIAKNARETYPEDGYCFQRADEIRKYMQRGSLATFSILGFSVQRNGCIHMSPEICIPCDRNVYKGQVNWLFHTVYELDGYVYSFEHDDLIPLNVYRKMIDQCTLAMYKGNFPVKTSRHNKYKVRMIYEGMPSRKI